MIKSTAPFWCFFVVLQTFFLTRLLENNPKGANFDAMLTVFFILGFVHQTQNSKNQTIIIPKPVQLAGFGLIILWTLSFFFKERKNTFNNTAFEKRKIEIPKKIHDMIEVDSVGLEKLEKLSTEELFQVLKKAEQLGNKILADLIRDILISRYADGEETIDCVKLVPNGTYVAVLVEVFGGKFWLIIVQSPEYLISLRKQDYYLGEANINVDDGIVEMKDKVVLQPESEYTPEKIKKLIGWFMKDLGFRPQ